MSYAQTVTGSVASSELGWTLMHEHILCDLRDPATRDCGCAGPEITIENRFEINYFQNRNQANMLLDDTGVAERELARFGAAGGRTIVDVTVGGLRPQPEELAALAKATGILVVFGAGYYVDAYLPDGVGTMDTEGLAGSLIEQLTDGAWGTRRRAGLIGEIGCTWPLAQSERRMLTAAVQAQKLTGACITIHPGRHPDAPRQIADVLEEAGVDPSRTVIGHMDRTIFDRDRLLELLNRGFVLEWDFFGVETSQYWMGGEDLDLPTDYMRLDLIQELMTAGYGEQITVSHDICTRTRLSSYGGHGYGHIFAHVVPIMLRRGWRDADVEQLLAHTPARLLGYLSEPLQENIGEPV